jgi:hypothetical protein
MEIHDQVGDRQALIKTLEAEGFKVSVYRDDYPLCCTVHAVRRSVLGNNGANGAGRR